MLTEKDLEKIAGVLGDAVGALSRPAWIMRRLSDVESVEGGTPPGENEESAPLYRRQPNDPFPTLENIGLLFSYGVTLRGYIDELFKMVEDLVGTKTLEDLDFLRIEANAQAQKTRAAETR